MRRAFAVHLALLLAVNVLVKPAYLLGIDVGVQNAVGTEAYGRLGYWLALTILFATLLDLGLQNYTAVTLARTPALVRERLPVLLSLKLAVAPVYAGAVLATAGLLGARASDLPLLVWIIAGQYGLSTWQMLRNNLAAQERYAVNSLISVADKLLLLVVVGALLVVPVWVPWITIERFAMLQALAVAVAIALTLAATDLAPGQRWLRWDAAALGGLLVASLPYALSLLLNTLATRLDMLMLRWLAPEGYFAVGVYSGVFRLLDGLNMVAYLFATLLVPMLSAQVERGDDPGPLVREGVRYGLALTLGAATWVSFHADAVCEALFREATPAWAPVLTALMWSGVGSGLLYVVGSHLLAVGRLRSLNLIFLGSTVVNVALNLALIPWFGALGAAVATALTYLVLVVAESAVSYRALPPSRLRTGASVAELLARAGAYVLLGGAVAYATRALGWGVIPALGAQALAALPIGLATGLVADPRELRTRLRTLAASRSR